MLAITFVELHTFAALDEPVVHSPSTRGASIPPAGCAPTRPSALVHDALGPAAAPAPSAPSTTAAAAAAAAAAHEWRSGRAAAADDG